MARTSWSRPLVAALGILSSLVTAAPSAVPPSSPTATCASAHQELGALLPDLPLLRTIARTAQEAVKLFPYPDASWAEVYQFCGHPGLHVGAVDLLEPVWIASGQLSPANQRATVARFEGLKGRENAQTMAMGYRDLFKATRLGCSQVLSFGKRGSWFGYGKAHHPPMMEVKTFSRDIRIMLQQLDIDTSQLIARYYQVSGWLRDHKCKEPPR